MSHSHPKSTRWLTPKKAREKYSLSSKELKRMREQREVTYRQWGNKFLYSEDSLDALFDEGKVLAEPQFKIVEKVVPIKGGDNTKDSKGSTKVKLARNSQKGGTKMHWVKGKSKDDGRPNGQFRLNRGDFTVFEYQEKGKFFYYIDYRDRDGVRHTKSLKRIAGQPIESRVEAYEVARRARNEMYERQIAKDDPNITFAEYVPIFLEKKKADRTLRHYEVIERMMNHLEKWFGELVLRDMSQKSGEAYRDYRRKTVNDPTIGIELNYLNQVLRKANDDGYDTKPIRIGELGLEPSRERTEFMTEEMEEVIWPLLKKHPPMDDLADFILSTSMRPVNILQLRWEDIRWEEGIAFIPAEKHKNKKDAEYLLSDEILEMLRRRQSENGSFELVFYRTECERPWPIKMRWYEQKWNEVREEANEILKEKGSDLRVPDTLRFYDLKATCLSRAGAKGATEFELQAISNHANTGSLQRYVRRKALQKSARAFLNGVGNRSEK